MLKTSATSYMDSARGSRVVARVFFSAALVAIIALFAFHVLATLQLRTVQGITPAKTEGTAARTPRYSIRQEYPETFTSTKVITPKSTVYLGVALSTWADNLTTLSAFEKDAKKKPSIVSWYQDWGATDGSQNFQTEWMDQVLSHGSIPLVTWEPWRAIPTPQGVNQPDFTLRNIINGVFDNYIRKWAQASKAWGYSYFLRFAQEMNGNWYPWDEEVNGNKPGEYILAWRHVHDIFTAYGVTNVTWVWSPNGEYPGALSFSEVYPGDQYVNWVAMDAFNWGTTQGTTWQTFSQIFGQSYKDMLKLTAKPLMIAETACAEQGGSKAEWIADTFGTQLPHNFPGIRAIIWFNQDKQRDWRIESSPSSQSAFANAIKSNIYGP